MGGDGRGRDVSENSAMKMQQHYYFPLFQFSTVHLPFSRPPLPPLPFCVGAVLVAA